VTVAMSGGTGNPVPTGTVTLSGGSYTSAATALSAGSATINIPANTLSVGSYTFKATYTPDATSVPIYAGASGTASTAVNVVAPTYTMSATSVTVAPGGSGSSTVTVNSTNGYTGTITLTCAITAEPTGATDLPGCTGGQVNFTSGTSAQGTVTLSTTAPSAALERPMLGPGKGWAGGGGAVLAVVLFFWLPIRRKTWRATFGVLLGLVLLGSLSACGGKSNNNNQNSNPGTTAGSYTITITGTGSDSAKTPATTTFVLTVS